MKKYYLHQVLFLLMFSIGFSQIKIGDNPNVINVRALLELESNTKGLLLPRLDTGRNMGYSGAEQGMFAYSTATNSATYWDGTSWVSLSAGKFVDGSNTDEATFVGGNNTRTRVGIGLRNPAHTFQIDANANTSDIDDNLSFTNKGLLLLGGTIPTSSNGEGALLELISNDAKGLLLPRITRLNSIPSTANINQEGMFVYDKDSKKTYYYDGNKWVSPGVFVPGIGSAGAINHAIFIGGDKTKTRVGIGIDSPEGKIHVDGDGDITTKGDVFIVNDAGNVGIGVDTPSEKLEIDGNIKSTGNIFSDSFMTRWDAATTYQQNDVVINEGLFYRRKNNGTSVGQPKSDSTNWDPISLSPTSKIIVDDIEVKNLKVVGSTAFPAADGKVLTSDSNGNALWKDPKNIYNEDGSLSGDRKLTLGAFNFTIEGSASTNNVVINNEGSVVATGDIYSDRFSTKWSSGGAYVIDDIVLYDGNFYKNLTGSNTANSPDLDSTNWGNFTTDNSNVTSGNVLTNNLGTGIADGAGSRIVNNIGTGVPTNGGKVINNIGSTGSETIINGSLKLNVPTPGQGKVLTSDANGNATWESPASGLFVGETANNLVKLDKKADGVTNRDPNTDFVITDTGRVGIGTTTPTQALDIAGNIASTGGVSAINFLATGSLTTATFTTKWVGNTAYSRNDIVLHQGVFYRKISTTDLSGVSISPDADSTNWESSTSNNANALGGNTVKNDIGTGIADGAGSKIINNIGTTPGTNGGKTINNIGSTNSETIIKGNLKLDVPTPGVGKVLTSDANGNATWQSSAKAGLFDNDATGALAKLTNKSDGTTARAGTEQFVIKDDGKVGIGIDAPTKPLDVNGEIRIRGGNPGLNKVLTSDANGNATWEDATLNNANALGGSTVTNNIGTGVADGAGSQIVNNLGTTPSTNGGKTINNIGSPNSETIIRGSLKLDVPTPGAGKVLTSDANGNATWQSSAKAGLFDNDNGNNLAKLTNKSDGITARTGAEQFVIKDDGKVGIGIDTPTNSLDVNGEIRIRGGNPGLNKVLTSDPNGNATWKDATFNNANALGGNTVTNNIGTGIADGAGSQIVNNLGTTTATNGGKTINNIGSPNSETIIKGSLKLDIPTPGVDKVLTSDANGNATWKAPAKAGLFDNDNGNNLAKLTNKSDGTTARTGAEQFVIKDDGSVGIGTNNPTKKLDVVGDIKSSGTLIASELQTSKITIPGQTPKDGQVLTTSASGTLTWTNGPAAPTDSHIGKNNLTLTDALRTFNIQGNTFRFEGTNNNIDIQDGDISTTTLSTSGLASVASLKVGTSNTVNQILVANALDGTVKWGDAPASGIFDNDATANLAKLTNKSDGTTARTGAEQFVIKDDGKVGIGIDTPTNSLDVNGEIRIRGGNPGLNKVLTSDANGNATWEDAPASGLLENDATANLAKLTNKSDGTTARTGAEQFVIKDDGSVGIGTNNPTKKLDVVGDIKSSGTLIASELQTSKITIPGQTPKNGQVLTTSASGTLTWTDGPAAPTDANDHIGKDNLTLTDALRTFNIQGNTFRFEGTNNNIDIKDGDISTTTLSTSGLASVASLKVGTSNTTNQILVANGTDGTVKWGDAPASGIFDNDATANLAKLTNKSDGTTARTGTEQFVIKDDGSVGIGINNPTKPLDINGEIRIRGGNPGLNKVLTSDANGNATWEDAPASGLFENDATGNLAKLTNKSDGTTARTGTEQFVIKDDGKVGIGKGTPTEQLDVVGNIKSSGTLFASKLQVSQIEIPGQTPKNGQVLTTSASGTLTWTDGPAAPTDANDHIGKDNLTLTDALRTFNIQGNTFRFEGTNNNINIKDGDISTTTLTTSGLASVASLKVGTSNTANQILVANGTDGTVKWGDAAGSGLFENDVPNTLAKLTNKSDGTPRTGAEQFVIKDDGKVGVGTDAPAATLDINGSIKVKGAHYDNVKKITLTPGGVGVIYRVQDDDSVLVITNTGSDIMSLYLPIDGHPGAVVGRKLTIINPNQNKEVTFDGIDSPTGAPKKSVVRDRNPTVSSLSGNQLIYVGNDQWFFTTSL